MCQIIPPQDAISERLFLATIHTLELYGVYLGRTLGLYKTLHQCGPLNARQLAEAAAISPRYAREWLEQQAVAGFITVDQEPASELAEERVFRLPSDYAGVLVHDDDLAHMAPFAHMVVGIAGVLPEVVRAYRNGTGVDYRTYGPDFRHGQSGINRPAFLHDLTHHWLPAVPGLMARLKQKQSFRIADVGCGGGWAAIGMAQAFPQAEVTGYDLDEASIHDARRHAKDRNVSVRFAAKDAAQMAEDGPFDLILLLETLHDMSRPVEVLTALRHALDPDGSIVIADERVEESFVAPGSEIERMMYGWSISHCLPVSMADQPSAAIGTAIRPGMVRQLAHEAGFSSCETLPVENPLFRFYELKAAA
ncbi:MAG TPA: class I SAM-dependent methyltransferase [Verrucomicrobium sp.]|nr:class I SAM-dependent methyltransferase [Verrucomicrobium sp.]